MLGVMGLMLFATLGQNQANVSSHQPSAKATASVGGINIGSADKTTPFVKDIFFQDIKTANKMDLFIDVSRECGVFTRTKVQSKGGNKDTSTAKGIVQIRALVDGAPALPVLV